MSEQCMNDAFSFPSKQTSQLYLCAFAFGSLALPILWLVPCWCRCCGALWLWLRAKPAFFLCLLAAPGACQPPSQKPTSRPPRHSQRQPTQPSFSRPARTQPPQAPPATGARANYSLKQIFHKLKKKPNKAAKQKKTRVESPLFAFGKDDQRFLSSSYNAPFKEDF